MHSCTKEKDTEADPKYIIEGHLYKDCSKIPISNSKLNLVQDHLNGMFGNNGGLLDTCTTDQYGYFKFEFVDKGGFELYIQYSNGPEYNRLLEFIPKKTSLTEIKIYQNPSASIRFKLNVLNPYSTTDTMTIYDFRDYTNNLEVVGPFQSGELYTVEKYYILEPSFLGVKDEILWYFNTYNGTYYSQEFEIKTYCDELLEVTLNIE